MEQKVLHQLKFASHRSSAISSCQRNSNALWSKLRPLLQSEPSYTSTLTAGNYALFFSDDIEWIRASTRILQWNQNKKTKLQESNQSINLYHFQIYIIFSDY